MSGEYRVWLLVIATALAAFAVIPTAWALLNGATLTELALNFGTEMFGALLTFGLITVLFERVRLLDIQSFQEKLEKAKLLDDLKIRLGSLSNEIAKQAAVDIARYPEWRTAELGNIDLTMANLKGADLSEFDLQGAELNFADLQDAVLLGTDLRGAFLFDANLEGATLSLPKYSLARMNPELFVKLTAQEWHLSEAEFLERFHFTSTEYISHIANLEVKFDTRTRLPDGSFWTPETDMRRFTDPAYIDENNVGAFWRSTNPKSPAYAVTTNDTST